MSNQDTVLNLLRSNPQDRFSNSDIVSRTRITPHQQVFQITQRLLKNGAILGKKHGKDWLFWVTSESKETREPKHRLLPSCIQSMKLKGNVNWEMLIGDFKKVAELAGIIINDDMIVLEMFPAPHKPPSTLPKGQMAIYVFMKGNDVFKVGKVGPNSQARYVSQHYNPKSAQSTLAASILADEDILKIAQCDEVNVGNWIKANLDRVNILLDQRLGISVLTLLEAYMQCRLKPKYEGFRSQRVP